jgi:hypothetical protein
MQEQRSFSIDTVNYDIDLSGAGMHTMGNLPRGNPARYVRVTIPRLEVSRFVREVLPKFNIPAAA